MPCKPAPCRLPRQHTRKGHHALQSNRHTAALAWEPPTLARRSSLVAKGSLQLAKFFLQCGLVQTNVGLCACQPFRHCGKFCFCCCHNLYGFLKFVIRALRCHCLCCWPGCTIAAAPTVGFTLVNACFGQRLAHKINMVPVAK